MFTEEDRNKFKYLFMMNLPLDELKSIANEDRMVIKYMNELERINEDPEFREFISREEDNRKIRNSLKKQYMKEAREEGLAEGVRETARKMIESGIDISTVSKITNLSKDELNEIMNSKEER